MLSTVQHGLSVWNCVALTLALRFESRDLRTSSQINGSSHLTTHPVNENRWDGNCSICVIGIYLVGGPIVTLRVRPPVDCCCCG